MLADRETAPAFHRMEISPDGAERLVLRFSGADIAVSPADGADLGIEFELRGADADLSAWQPSVRRIEGILVIGEDSGPVKVTEIRARLPVALRDLEIHGRSGDVEVRGLSMGLVIETGSGRIRVAGAASLEARSSEGEIETEDTGLSDIKTGAGRIRAVRPEGRMTARSESGDIEVEEAAADLYLETATGEIGIARPHGRVRAMSQSGDIEIDAPLPFGGGEANTTSGHIGLSLSGASLELRAETLSGRLRTPHGEVGNNTGPRRAALTVAQGGRRLHAKSISGDIEIDF